MLSKWTMQSFHATSDDVVAQCFLLCHYFSSQFNSIQFCRWHKHDRFFITQVLQIALQQHFSSNKNSTKSELLCGKWMCCPVELPKTSYTWQTLPVKALQTEDRLRFTRLKYTRTPMASTRTTKNGNIMSYMWSQTQSMYSHLYLVANALYSAPL